MNKKILDDENNILKMMSTYNSTNVESVILTLKKELEQQIKINNTLTDKNFEEKSQEITDFIARNEGQIDDQIGRLSDIVNSLREMVINNNKLEENAELYTETVKSDKAVLVSKKITQLKNLKKEIFLFLENSGIDPQLNIN